MHQQLGVSPEPLAREIQEKTLGFVPTASLMKLEMGLPLSSEDILLLALFFLPFAGALGKSTGAIGGAISRTFRVTVPFTGRSFEAWRVLLRVIRTGSFKPAGQFTIRSLGTQLGPAFGKTAARIFSPARQAIIATWPPAVQIWMAFKLMFLERALTRILRSVPTQTGFVIARVAGPAYEALYEAGRNWAGTFRLLALPYEEFARAFFMLYLPEIWAMRAFRSAIEGYEPPELPPTPTLKPPHVSAPSVASTKTRFKQARADAIAQGWPGHGKMTKEQKRAFKAAMRGGKKRSSSASPTTTARSFWPDSSPFGLLVSEFQEDEHAAAA